MGNYACSTPAPSGVVSPCLLQKIISMRLNELIAQTRDREESLDNRLVKVTNALLRQMEEEDKSQSTIQINDVAQPQASARQSHVYGQPNNRKEKAGQSSLSLNPVATDDVAHKQREYYKQSQLLSQYREVPADPPVPISKSILKKRTQHATQPHHHFKKIHFRNG